jgi:ribonuclease HI
MIKIYTDGSALAKYGHPNDMKGGFGIVFTINGIIKKKISKGFFPTKTGRMELKAILTALEILSKDQKAIIYSDSMYALNCFLDNRLKKWERFCWPNEIKNQDILKKLLSEYRKFSPNAIKFKHIKGHTGNEFNELADSLASYKNFSKFELDLPLKVLEDKRIEWESKEKNKKLHRDKLCDATEADIY